MQDQDKNLQSSHHSKQQTEYKDQIQIDQKSNNNAHRNTISQNLYELLTDVGRLTIQVISLKNYKWIIITNSDRLIIDGSLQLSMQTPFSDHPSVLDIGADENQAQSQTLCKKLTKQLGCPIILSLNLQVGLNNHQQMKVIKYLKEINKKLTQNTSSKENKMEQV